MRTRKHFFTQAERKAALWAMITAVIIAATGIAWDRAAGPSIGLYENMGPKPLIGVIEAQPLA